MRSGGCDFKLCLSLNERHHVITTRRRTLLAPVFALSLISVFGLTACGSEDTTAEPSTTTVTSAPSGESKSSEPETATVTSAPEDTPPPPTTVTSTPEPTQQSSRLQLINPEPLLQRRSNHRWVIREQALTAPPTSAGTEPLLMERRT